MPELPEVEVTCLGLKPLLSLSVKQIVIRNYSLRWPINPKLPQILKKQTLLSWFLHGLKNHTLLSWFLHRSKNID